jgi:hypothetical protein
MDTIEKGRRAEILQHDEYLKLTLDEMERELIDIWRNSGIKDGELREACYHRIKSIVWFRDKFAEHISEKNIEVQNQKLDNQ